MAVKELARAAKRLVEASDEQLLREIGELRQELRDLERRHHGRTVEESHAVVDAALAAADRQLQEEVARLVPAFEPTARGPLFGPRGEPGTVLRLAQLAGVASLGDRWHAEIDAAGADGRLSPLSLAEVDERRRKLNEEIESRRKLISRRDAERRRETLEAKIAAIDAGELVVDTAPQFFEVERTDGSFVGTFQRDRFQSWRWNEMTRARRALSEAARHDDPVPEIATYTVTPLNADGDAIAEQREEFDPAEGAR